MNWIPYSLLAWFDYPRVVAARREGTAQEFRVAYVNGFWYETDNERKPLRQIPCGGLEFRLA